MVNSALLMQARQLSAAERVELVDAIMDTLDADAWPVTDDVATLVDRRVAEAKADPTGGRPSDEVVTELRARIR